MSAKRDNARGEKIKSALYLFCFRHVRSRASRSPNAQGPVVQAIIALFTDNFTHLHYNAMQRGHEAISGCLVIFARNCLAFVFSFIVMQM